MGKKTCKNAFPWEMFCVLKEKTDYYPFTLRSLVSKNFSKTCKKYGDWSTQEMRPISWFPFWFQVF